MGTGEMASILHDIDIAVLGTTPQELGDASSE